MGRGRKKKPNPVAVVRMTDERAERNAFASAGMAQRVVPVIEMLWKAGKLSHQEYSALDYYRNQASQAEDDAATQSVLSPDKIMGGGHNGVPVGGYIPASLIPSPAILETARIERDLGTLREIARAIAVDDLTLAQWCINRFGGRERYDGKGRLVAIVPINEKRHIEFARMELRIAATRIAR